MTAPHPHPHPPPPVIWCDRGYTLKLLHRHCKENIILVCIMYKLSFSVRNTDILLVDSSFLLNDKKVSTKKRENNAKNNSLFRYFYLYTWYFRFSSFSPLSSIFLSFSRFFIVFRNISLDFIWISRNWPALKYFAFPNTDTTTGNLISCYLINFLIDGRQTSSHYFYDITY